MLQQAGCGIVKKNRITIEYFRIVSHQNHTAAEAIWLCSPMAFFGGGDLHGMDLCPIFVPVFGFDLGLSRI